MNSAGELFGTTSLQNLCSSPADNPQALIDNISASLAAFTAGTPQSDDITLLAVSYR